MRHYALDENKGKWKYLVLIKQQSFSYAALRTYYLNPLTALGLDPNEVCFITLEYKGKTQPAKDAKAYLEQLKPVFCSMKAEALLVCDSSYFKYLTKKKKADPYLGIQCKTELFKDLDLPTYYGINYGAIAHNPNNEPKLERALASFAAMFTGAMTSVKSIIKHAYYPDTVEKVKEALAKLHEYPALAIDTENYSLYHRVGSIATISFAWNKHEGIAFNVDLSDKCKTYTDKGKVIDHHAPVINEEIAQLLVEFFSSYEGATYYHNLNYDVKFLVYRLFLKYSGYGQWSDEYYEKQIQAVKLLTKNAHCTRVLAYLCTNNAVENKLGLKDLAQEFGGAWALDEIKDIKKCPESKLLTYNLEDACCTFYLKEKYEPLLITENQHEVYETIFRPAYFTLVMLELNGMPMSREQLTLQDRQISKLIVDFDNTLKNNIIIQNYEDVLREELAIKYNIEHVKKTKDASDFADFTFNPGSPKQVSRLLFEELGFEVQSLTDTGQPSTGGDDVENLLKQLIAKFGLDGKDYGFKDND